MSAFPAAMPHGRIEEILPDVFLVSGSFRIGPGMIIPRNMIVLRSGKELTLVNAIRLGTEGERELEALGQVSHVANIGLFHTTDLLYVRDRFSKATFWSPEPKNGEEKLVEGEKGPVSRAKTFVFATGKRLEAAFVVEQAGGNLLVTCDSVQNWADTSGCSFIGGLVSRMMGFLVPAKIGPIWLKQLTDGQPAKMRPDFDRLLSMDFSRLIAGHGALLRDGAREALAASCVRQGVREAAR